MGLVTKTRMKILKELSPSEQLILYEYFPRLAGERLSFPIGEMPVHAH